MSYCDFYQKSISLMAMDIISGLSPEIVHFRTPSDGLDAQMGHVPHDWYIKGVK